jgi:transposase
MQGRKEIQPKMIYQVHLGDLVAKDNFYRKLNNSIDLSFIYKETAKYYGSEGQESIDPVVFFKICLIGYLNNINSDRKLIEYCSNCLDIRLYVHYDIDEALPWHSTISRTRQLYGEEVFLELFKKVLSLCVQQGMVRGKRQAVDSAFIKANASLDSIIEKEIMEDVPVYANELNQGSEFQIETPQLAEELLKEEKETGDSKNIKNKNNPGDNAKGKFNDTHFSTTDPDARLSVKPGKVRQLNYYGQLAVDDANHVITGAIADFADKRDSQCLPQILEQTINNLKQHAIQIEQVCADTNYSSGSALKFLEQNNIEGYIPNVGSYKLTREGFIYNLESDQWECQRGNKAILKFKGIRNKEGYERKIYRSHQTDCKGCPFLKTCLGKNALFKRIEESLDKPYYDRMHKKMQSNYGKRIVRIRSKTVEPVLGTLINFMNMRRVNTRGIKQANKHVLMAALCYNLKKYLKFIKNNPRLAMARRQNEAETGLALLKPTIIGVFKAILSSTNYNDRLITPKISIA